MFTMNEALLLRGHRVVIISQATMKIFFSVALLSSVLLPSAFGAEPFYVGTWKITAAAVAPWRDGPPYESDLVEMKTLVNKMVTIQPGAIAGPRPLACKGPRYRVKDYSADMLFQGEFGEMYRRDHSADPAKIATKLGFRGASWKTLETGCGNELDYHFLDPATAAFGLNNYVYTLKKQ
jgi:hypothetical protein